MVQKNARPRGRPRQYDPETALDRARAVFWDAGYTATSLEELSAGTGMNRPSLYGAFGDKHALYQLTLEGYRETAWGGLRETLRDDLPLRDALHALYEGALSLYLSGEHGARGCYLIGTALTQAVLDGEVRQKLGDALHEIDASFEARLLAAKEKRELRSDADPAALAKLASAVLHTLAIRARAGEPREALAAIADAGVDLICR